MITRLTAEVIVAVDCTRLTVAIERYRRNQDDGELPETLTDLVPTHIESIPLDPFTGKQLFYRYDEESYMVYSASANRTDDGGSIRPKEGEKIPLDRGLRIRLDMAQ
jgi:hypothetical protein